MSPPSLLFNMPTSPSLDGIASPINNHAMWLNAKVHRLSISMERHTFKFSHKKMMKPWWMQLKRMRRVGNFNPQQWRQFILRMAVAQHVIFKRNRRGKLISQGLSKMMSLVIVPFLLPLLIVLLVPTLIFFFPLLVVSATFSALNSRARMVLNQIKHQREEDARRLEQLQRRKRRSSLIGRSLKLVRAEKTKTAFASIVQETNDSKLASETTKTHSPTPLRRSLLLFTRRPASIADAVQTKLQADAADNPVPGLEMSDLTSTSGSSTSSSWSGSDDDIPDHRRRRYRHRSGLVGEDEKEEEDSVSCQSRRVTFLLRQSTSTIEAMSHRRMTLMGNNCRRSSLKKIPSVLTLRATRRSRGY